MLSKELPTIRYTIVCVLAILKSKKKSYLNSKKCFKQRNNQKYFSINTDLGKIELNTMIGLLLEHTTTIMMSFKIGHRSRTLTTKVGIKLQRC